jgi:hypothetical protein
LLCLDLFGFFLLGLIGELASKGYAVVGINAVTMAAIIHKTKRKMIPRQILAIKLRMPNLVSHARHS